VTRRRSLAALTAAGTPRGVLQRAVLMQAMLPLIPTAILAAFAGIHGARGVMGTTTEVSATTDGSFDVPAVSRIVPIPVPLQQLTVLVAGSLLVTLLITSAALVLLRRSTDPAELRTTA